MPDATLELSGPPSRSEVVLAAMAAGGRGTLFEPVRIQEFLFLIDREAAHLVGGPHFSFRPYRYGPFDAAVYAELEALERTGEVRIAAGPHRRTYALTKPGQVRGRAILEQLPQNAPRYLGELARWVLSLGFGRLLAAIYRRYPDMAANSVAPGLADRYAWSSPGFPERPFLEGMASAFDLTGAFHESPPSREDGFRRDGEALAADWRAVGDDLRAAMADFATGQTHGA